MTPTPELTQEGFDRVVGDAIDVVTRVYAEARQAVLYVEKQLKKQRGSLGVVQVFGPGLEKMLYCELRSWVGVVAGDGLADEHANDTASGVDAEDRPRRSFQQIEPGGRLLFAKIVLRVPRTRSEPHVLIGLVDQFRTDGEKVPAILPLRVGRFNALVDVMDDGLWQGTPVLVKTRTPVDTPRRGSLTVRLASEPIKFPLFDLQGPDDLDRVVDGMLSLLKATPTGV